MPGHMLTDAAALLFALLAVRFSRRPPTIRHTFGWLRLTTLAAFVNAIALVVITILIVWEAIERFQTPRPVAGGMMMAIAVAGSTGQRARFLGYLHRGSEEKNLNVRAAALHVIGRFTRLGRGNHRCADYYLDGLDTRGPNSLDSGFRAGAA